MSDSLEIVIVLYECLLEESISFTSLQRQLKDIKVDYELVIFNNDENRVIESDRFLVENSTENLKISGAYNFALERAVKTSKNWLLLLDQDTEVPENYFVVVQKFLEGGYSPDLAAVVPVLKSGEIILSPKAVSPFLRLESDINHKGYNKWITAINSMSLMNVDFLQSIGGFSNKYQLDMLDRWSYTQLMKHNKPVYVLDLCSNHNLSFLNLEENITPARYSDYMKVESIFVADEMNHFYRVFHKIKLFVRSLRQLVKYKNKTFSKITFSNIFKK